MRTTLLLALLAAGCSTSMPSTPSDLDQREADCRASASSFELDVTVYPRVMTAYAGSIWTIEANEIIVDGHNGGLSDELTLAQRSCSGQTIATWSLTDEVFTLHNPRLVPLDGAMLVLGTRVLTGDYPAGEVHVWAFDVDESERVFDSTVDLPDTARFATLLDADAHDGVLTLATRHLTPDQERVAIVQVPDLLDAETTTNLASYRVDDGYNISIGSLATTDAGPTLVWQTQWPSLLQFLARNGGAAERIDDDFHVALVSAGNEDWMWFGPTIEDLNTGATLALPDQFASLMPSSEGLILQVRGSGDSGDALLRYDTSMTLTQTIPVEELPSSLIDLGEGVTLLWRTTWLDGLGSQSSFELLPNGGE